MKNDDLFIQLFSEIKNSPLEESKSYSVNTLKLMEVYNINLSNCNRFIRDNLYEDQNITLFISDMASHLTEGAKTITALVTTALAGCNKIFGSRLPVLPISIIIGAIKAVARVRVDPVYIEAKRQHKKQLCANMMKKAILKVVGVGLASKLLFSILTGGPVMKLLENVLRKLGLDLNHSNKTPIEQKLDLQKIEQVA